MIQTITSLTQKGANLYIRLAGDADTVQRDLYLLANYGLTEIPLFYKEGDTEVLIESNCYRVAKFVASQLESAALVRGGWQAVRRLRKSGELERRTKVRARRLVRAFRTSACMDSAADYSTSHYSTGRTSAEREEGERWDSVSDSMASVADYAERVTSAAEHVKSR